MNNVSLFTKLNSLPAELRKEVEEFIQTLLVKSQGSKKKTNRQPGLAKGLIEMKPGFDDPLDDFKVYME